MRRRHRQPNAALPTAALTAALVVAAAMMFAGCNGETPSSGSGKTLPAGKHPSEKVRGPYWLKMPDSARYERSTIVMPKKPDEGIRLLARLDLPEKDLPKFLDMNASLPSAIQLKKDDAIFKDAGKYGHLVAWWRLSQIKDPKCARVSDVAVPTPPKPEPKPDTAHADGGNTTDTRASVPEDAKKALKPPLEARRWTVTICAGEPANTVGWLRIFVAFEEEHPTPEPANDVPTTPAP